MRWLLAELEQRFSDGLDELARRFDRSVSWVSRRWATEMTEELEQLLKNLKLRRILEIYDEQPGASRNPSS